jgi:hypothetical protein
VGLRGLAERVRAPRAQEDVALRGGSAPARARLDARAPGDAQVGWFDRIKPTLSKREASATPPAFRDALLDIARNAADPELLKLIA